MNIDIDLNNKILIIPNNIKTKVVKNINNLPKLSNVKILTDQEFITNLTIDYNEKAIIYLMNNKNLSYQNAKEIIKNLKYATNDNNDCPKLQELTNIKNELSEKNLLIINKQFIPFIKDKEIIFYGFDYINKFGYGKKTGIDLNGEATGILFSLDKVGPVELATTAFGQGVSVTALQQVVAVSAAINGGTLYKPYIVKRVAYHENGQIIKEVKPTIVRDNIVTKDTSEKVRMTLESVVSLGTGRNAYIDGYRVGGKTGTAQKVNNGIYMQGNYIVSFIGFLPANDPKIVVYLAIDNPKGVTQYGGTVSAPIVKNIMEDAITSLNIEKQDGGTEKRYQWYDKKYYTVPNVVGKSKKEATSMLKSFSVEYSGSGDVVVNQSPDSDSRIAEGEKVRLYLG